MVADHRVNNPTSARCSCSLLVQHIHVSAHTCEELNYSKLIVCSTSRTWVGQDFLAVKDSQEVIQ